MTLQGFPLNFDFTIGADARAGFHRPAGRLHIEGLDLRVADPGRTWSQQMLSLVGFRGAMLRQMRFLGVRQHGHNAMSISQCLDADLQDLYFDNIVYGVTVGNSRHTRFARVESYNSRHPVVPASWSDGIFVDGLRGDNNHGIMDAHPAFDIHYHNVHSGIEAGTSNLRSVGGSIRNSTFVYRDEIQWGPYFQSVALVDPEIYRDYRFEMENVTWKASRPLAIARGGEVILRNVRNLDLNGQPVGINVGPNVGRLVLDNTLAGQIRVADVTVPGDNRLDAETRLLEWPGPDGAILTGDGHVLDFQNNLLTRTRHHLRAHGWIVQASDRDPLETRLRVYDTYTGQAGYPPAVDGVLKLKAFISHANAGSWQILEQHYHFRHQRVQTRGLSFQTTPVYVSDPAGQANATLELTLSDPVHDAPHDAATDRWFQVDIRLRSGRTRPQYRLYYEIELYGR